MGSPADIHSSVHIGWGSVTTGYAKEMRLTFTIGFINTTTQRTGARGVSRVYGPHAHACQSCLVFDKTPQLKERPTMQCTALAAANSCSVTYPTEFFDSNTLTECLRSPYNAFADYMVLSGCKAALFPLALHKQLSCGLCTLALQLGSKSPVSVPDAFDKGTGIDVALTVNSKIHDTHVNTKKASRFTEFRLRCIDSGIEIVLTVLQKQISLALLRKKQPSSPFVRLIRYAFSTRKRRKCHFVSCLIPAQYTTIVGDRAMSSKCTLALLVQLISVGNLRNHSDYQLSGQGKLILDAVIQHFLSGVHCEGAVLPHPLTDKVSGIVGCFHRGKQSLRLFWARAEFHLCSQLHTYIISSIPDNYKKRGLCATLFLPNHSH